MLVSVIIPTYNYGRFLAEALDIVLGQTVSDLEVIIVDDGSTDDTPEILARFDDPRVRAVRIPNQGVSVARNTGLDLASGEFVAFLDADDRWLPEKLARQLAMFRADPDLGLVFTNLRRFNEAGVFGATQFDFIPELATLPSRPVAGGQVLTGDTFTTLVQTTQFATWLQTVLLQRSAVEGLRFPPGVRLSQDTHYMYRVYPRVRAGFLTDPLVEVRRHGRNSYVHVLQKLEMEPRILVSLLREPLATEHHAVLRRSVGRAWCSLGWHHFHRGAPFLAAPPYLRSLAYPGQRLSALKHLLALPAAPLLARRKARSTVDSLTGGRPS
jgi:glycosyltransferase involved in cell wall biosynthesis